MKHLEDQNILSDRQFGFRSKHSCESQLFITINDIAKQIDTNLQVDAAILDFSKAFDKVSHSSNYVILVIYALIDGTNVNFPALVLTPEGFICSNSSSCINPPKFNV